MSLNKILSIAGKPGLFKLVTQTRSGFVAESLLDGKKVTVSFKNNVSVLSEIAIYTLEEEVYLKQVFEKSKEEEEGGKTAESHKDDKIKLEEYLFEVLANYDAVRVYASDIKKIIQWYNLLHEHGITEYADEEVSPEEKI